MDAALNQLEGKYEIIEKLSEGGMGAVYKVRHRLLEELRVIKVMRPHLAQDEVLRARFVREAKTAIRLRHRNIAQVYDFTADEDGAFFLVMEFIDGINLFDLLKVSGPPSLGLALEIAFQTLGVLGYLHRKEIIHRDISPDNLMIGRDEDGSLLIKLIDLGIAKTIGGAEHLTATGAFLGKIRYSSPEQFRTKDGQDVGPQSDLYSFGVVFYELLTGCYPIKGNSLTSLMNGHLTKAPLDFSESDPKGRIPDPLRELVMRALEKDPEKRFSSARSFRTRLGELRTQHPFDDLEIEELLRISSTPTEKMEVIRPGSTQDRLDRNFGVQTTPVPRGTGLKTAPSDPEVPFRALLLGIEKLIESGHFDEAALQIRSAETMKPGHKDIVALQKKLETVDARVQARRQAAVATIQGALVAEDLDRAKELLKRATRDFGTTEEFEELSAEIRKLEKDFAARQERISGILDSARELMKAESWEDAVLMLQEALILQEGHSEAMKELERAQKGLEAQRQAERRQKEIEESLGGIRALLDAREPEEARRALDVARKLSGQAPEFQGLDEEIQDIEKAIREERTAALVEEAGSLIKARDFENAIAYLEEALRLSPGSEETWNFLEEAREGRRLQEEEEKRQREIEGALQGVHHLLRAGRLETAVHQVEDILGEYGEAREAEKLRTRIREEIEEKESLRIEVLQQVKKADDAKGSGDFNRAEEVLLKARDDAVDFPEIYAEVESMIEGLKEAEKEYRRQMEINKASEAIRRQLEAGAFEEATRELELAERLFRKEHNWVVLRHELEGALREEKIHKLIRESLSGVLGFEAMIERIEEALRLDPTREKTRILLKETRIAQEKHLREKRNEAIAEILAPVDELIREGQLEQALTKVNGALKKMGPFPQGKALRQRLQRALKRT